MYTEQNAIDFIEMAKNNINEFDSLFVGQRGRFNGKFIDFIKEYSNCFQWLKSNDILLFDKYAKQARELRDEMLKLAKL